METSRRTFIQSLAMGLGGVPFSQFFRRSKAPEIQTSQTHAMLYDTTRCIGCRSCETACATENHLPIPSTTQTPSPPRKTGEQSFTVVNTYPNPANPNSPVFRKEQCMHCVKPACESACLVDAFRKNGDGSVTWDEWKCIGCRYCMLACPFQMVKFEFSKAFAPRMRKCTFCHSRLAKGETPACSEACPADAIAFGNREVMLAEGRRRIRENPAQYLNHIYGENEIGGTAKLYLSGHPFDKINLLPLKEKRVTELSETNQKNLVKNFLPPLALFGSLFGLMKILKPKSKDSEDSKKETF